MQEENGLKLDVELTGAHLREVVRRFKVRGWHLHRIWMAPDELA